MSNTESTNVAQFYDDFSVKQIRTGNNLRHYILAKILKNYGIKKSESILEIGCGIGVFTKLIAKVSKSASIMGVDISKKNIELAQQYLKGDRFKFNQYDFSEIVDLNRSFDFIVLADVIEHIPIDKYATLFSNIKKCCNNNTKIFINIPHPHLIDYLKTNNPNALQIIDQAVYQKFLLHHFIDNQFEIVECKEYSIFNQQNDYIFYMLVYNPIKPNIYSSKGIIYRIFKKWIIRLTL